jgi:hypothetical protein
MHQGKLLDIEDMGIKWGSALSCKLHGWTFSLESGICDTNAYILPIHGLVLGPGDSVWVTKEATNAHIPGPRRDFGGQELLYDPSSGSWV